jgi:feruloyl-CoA synthase
MVRETFAVALAAFAAEHPGGSTGARRAWLLDSPPLLDSGEVTDKGSLNQAAVLRHRAAVVDRLYDGPDETLRIVT